MNSSHHLASAALSRGDYATARRLMQESLTQSPKDAAALTMLGMACAGLNDWHAAKTASSLALSIQPDDPYALYTLANVHIAAKEWSAAIGYLNRTIEVKPAFIEAWLQKAHAHHQSGDLASAQGALLTARQLQPSDARICLGLSQLYQDAGHPDEALKELEQLCQMHPQLAAAWFNLGNLLVSRLQYAAAIEAYQHARMLTPHDKSTLLNLAKAYTDDGQLSQAQSLYEHLRNTHPKDPLVLLQLGNFFSHLDNLNEAERSYRAAIECQPTYAAAWSNLGNTLHAEGRLNEALEAHREAVRLTPGVREYQANLALAELTIGEFESGWVRFEARFDDRALLTFSGRHGAKRWGGEPETASDLVLVAEAGLGDVIQYLRYGRWFNEHGIRPQLQCAASLVALARSSGFFSEVYAHQAVDKYPASTWYPLLSVARWIHPRAGFFAMPTPYLKADADRLAHWQSALNTIPKFKVAIVWQGNPAVEKNSLRGRSLPLSFFKPLAQPDVQLISLQKGAGYEQLEGLAWRAQVLDWGAIADLSGSAFIDSAAILGGVDLVITSDTSLAHLAGALGRPVWVALHSHADWRWGMHGDATGWYPSMRLYRQTTRGDWRAVIDQMQSDLTRLISSIRPTLTREKG